MLIVNNILIYECTFAISGAYCRSFMSISWPTEIQLKTKRIIHLRRQMVQPRHRTPQGISIDNQDILLQVFISLVCKSDVKEIYGNTYDSLFEKDLRG